MSFQVLLLMVMVLLLVTLVVISTQVRTSLTDLSQVQSTKGFQETKSLLLQVNQAQAKRFSVLALYVISSNLILMVGLFILSLRVH